MELSLQPLYSQSPTLLLIVILDAIVGQGSGAGWQAGVEGRLVFVSFFLFSPVLVFPLGHFSPSPRVLQCVRTVWKWI